jgi:hypothetical protein
MLSDRNLPKNNGFDFALKGRGFSRAVRLGVELIQGRELPPSLLEVFPQFRKFSHDE